MKPVSKIILLILLLQGIAFSKNTDKQNLDSLYNLFVSSHTHNENSVAKIGSNGNKPLKCGTFLAYKIRENYNSFTTAQQAVLKPMLERPDLQTSMVSPAGHFRIHYDTTGVNVPAYDVNLFAMALDSSYNFEVNYLGFPAAPSDNGQGGDNLYDVYIISMGGDYGRTNFSTGEEVSPGSGTYISYMELDNAFGPAYGSHGIEGARVTAAHEFHHAIQLGNYGYRDADVYFMELTSVSMEDFVFDSINDYLNYTYTFFGHPSRCFARSESGNDGYDLAIWHFYLKKKFGFDVIKKEWDYFKKYQAIVAIDKALQEYGSSFLEAYNEFGLWLYYTGYRANTEKYLPDGDKYPVMQPDLTIDFYSNSRSIDLTSFAGANNFMLFFNSNTRDTLMAVVTNGDVQTASVATTTQNLTFNYSLYNYNAANSKMITGDYYYTKTPGNSNASFWLQGAILNNTIETGTDSVSYPNISYVYPSPFSYNLKKCPSQIISIPVNNTDWGKYDIKVYNTSMQLVYNKTDILNILNKFHKKIVTWNGRGNSGDKLATGIYIYAIKTENCTQTGKIAIINE